LTYARVEKKRDPSIDITASSEPLRRAKAKPDTCSGLAVIDDECERWTALIPDEPLAPWNWCVAQKRETLLALLALWVALTAYAVQRKGEPASCKHLLHASALAQTLSLDMRHWFTPDAKNLFGRLSRSSIIAAIEEAKGLPAAPAGQNSRRPSSPSWHRNRLPELGGCRSRCVEARRVLPGDAELQDGESDRLEAFPATLVRARPESNKPVLPG